MITKPDEKYFRPGQHLFHEDEPSDCIYLIKKGTVSIRKMKGSAYIEIGRLYSNEVLGELSFFDRQPRSAAAVALTEVETIEIKFQALDKIYDKVPDYMKTIISCVAERLRKANETIKRLQKNVVSDEVGKSSDSDQPSASEVLAATANISIPVQDSNDHESDDTESEDPDKK
ncbi:MAG: cyclic nucleotide-binding domain-containing protein [Candidatus Poribacteria bacterium]